MAGGVKIRAKVSGDNVQVKALMSHPMETGQRKDKKGEKIPAHFIKEVTIESGGKVLMKANWGPAVSKNPYVSVRVTGPQKGDMIKVSYVDNQGESGSAEGEVA